MTNTCSCGCCTGAVKSTPASTANLPGRAALQRRVGTYASFLASMRAELSSNQRPGLVPLQTRAMSDPAIALADAWAVVGDVLTFYQERLADEGYLRTATERFSVVEIANLIGYVPRPGVASTVHLAYTLDLNSAPVEIPAGSKAQNVPDPGEQMQTFETSEPLAARVEWNTLRPRLGRQLPLSFVDALTLPRIQLGGSALNLKKGDRLLFTFADPSNPQHVAHVVRRVESATPVIEFAAAFLDKGMTAVELQPVWPIPLDTPKLEALKERFRDLHDKVVAGVKAGTFSAEHAAPVLSAFEQHALGSGLAEVFLWADNVDTTSAELKALAADVKAWVGAVAAEVIPPPPKAKPATDPRQLLELLDRRPVRIAASAATLPRTVAATFTERADVPAQLLTHLRPRAGEIYYRAWRNLPPVHPPPPRPPETVVAVEYSAVRLSAIDVFRSTAGMFGNNAPPKLLLSDGHVVTNPLEDTDELDTPTSVSLDVVDDAIGEMSLVLLEAQHFLGKTRRIVGLALNPVPRGRSSYGLTGKSTRFDILAPGAMTAVSWRTMVDGRAALQAIAHIRAQRLERADDPLATDVGGDAIELDTLLDGLQSGRHIIVVGERTDVKAADGSVIPNLEGRELMMIAGVGQDAPAGDKPHTTLKLAQSLANAYKRETVRIYANVVKATHGETHDEPAGSGNAAKTLQQFTLKRAPLTYVSAPTASGIETTLTTRVNDVRWRETDTLAVAGPSDRVYVVRVTETGETAITFGTGEHGARLPTGTLNVRTKYRSGIGKPGNVKADTITLLASRPLGVRDVINPLRSSGGADAEDRDHVRSNAPLAVAALDRLVGISDYADFARTFGGVGHADAIQLTDGQRQVVHVTIAGIDDIPIDADSDLIGNLAAALRRYGDPWLPVVVAPRELLSLILSATVSMDPDYLWDDVSRRVRASMLETFTFARRGLGRSAYLSEAIAAIQRVRGVVAVDVDVFDAVSERELADAEALRAKIAQLTGTGESTLKQPRAVVTAAHAQLASAAPERAKTWPEGTTLLPAQLAFFVPQVGDTLILNRR